MLLSYITQSYAWIHSRVKGHRMQGIEKRKNVKVFSNMETCSVTWDNLLIFYRLQCIHVNSEDDIPKRVFMEV